MSESTSGATGEPTSGSTSGATSGRPGDGPAPGAAFAVGDRVRVRAVDPDGHTRAPRYVRGHVGRVVERQGNWALADERAAGVEDARSEPVYTVAFAARDLWGEGEHEVTVDLWESYLQRYVPSGRDTRSEGGR